MQTQRLPILSWPIKTVLQRLAHGRKRNIKRGRQIRLPKELLAGWMNTQNKLGRRENREDRSKLIIEYMKYWMIGNPNIFT